ncbi:OLC1v1000176C1 [Oldenlandia corymbosa var. corymbosa]|uniref:OLC1v1000176C1 n=1 Tax=Oldenlandia corymbosa var. corymbosa TaxID=529605 RepID=A0AAV1D4R2_OLDCO|nr:OLC1v1000176C1 [Oldenlandia corymbosa var. corymbosa]
MAAVRFSRLRSLGSLGKFLNPVEIRPSSGFIARNYHREESGSFKSSWFSSRFGIESLDNSYGRGMKSAGVIGIRPSSAFITRNYCSEEFQSVKSSWISNRFGIVSLDNCYDRGMKRAGVTGFNLSNSSLKGSIPFSGIAPRMNYGRSYSSGVTSHEANPRVASASSGGDNAGGSGGGGSGSGSGGGDSGGLGGSDWTQYIGPAWKSAVIISIVLFVHRWKTNVIAKSGLDQETKLMLDRGSSVLLVVFGFMALAEAWGVAPRSILTIGGVGGLAAAFATKDIFGNILSGLWMQFFSRPFSVGDTIRAGSVEGQVMEMGLTTTTLLSTEKFPVIVPNSVIYGQVIVNKSRAKWRAFDTKIPLQNEDLKVIPKIADDIKAMLRSNPNVFLDKEAPYCYLSRVGSYAELNIGCNMKNMGKEQLFSAQQDILLQSVQIIKRYGATISSYPEN